MCENSAGTYPAFLPHLVSSKPVPDRGKYVATVLGHISLAPDSSFTFLLPDNQWAEGRKKNAYLIIGKTIPLKNVPSGDVVFLRVYRTPARRPHLPPPPPSLSYVPSTQALLCKDGTVVDQCLTTGSFFDLSPTPGIDQRHAVHSEWDLIFYSVPDGCIVENDWLTCVKLKAKRVGDTRVRFYLPSDFIIIIIYGEWVIGCVSVRKIWRVNYA